MYYSGIDAHAKYLTVTVLSKSGEEVVAPTRVECAEPGEIVRLLAPFRPLRAVVEACPFWPWIYERLTAAGIEFVLANPKRLKAIAAAKQKNDRVDSRLLARMLRASLIPEAYPKPARQRELARLVRHRVVLGRQRTGLLNRIHGQLHACGLRLDRGRLQTQQAREWLRREAWPQLDAEQQQLIVTHLELIDVLDPMIKRLDRRIEKVGGEESAVQLLCTIPGIGAYRGLLLAVEILPLWRFPGPEQLVSYAGLAPITRSSGGKTHHGPIPAEANRWVRGALVQSVVSHLRAAPDSPLSRYYAEQKRRLGWPTARVATARKLCRVIYQMLKTGEAWREPSEEDATDRDELHSPHATETALPSG